jgi:uncharacterized protein (TIGR02145 family)
MRTWSCRLVVIGLTLLAAAALPVTGAAKTPQPALDVTYIANEGFLIQAAGKKVLVDALFDDGFGTYLAPSKELLAQMTGGGGPFADVDLLLVTHPHGDHFNPKLVVEFLRNHVRCRLVAHTQVVDLLRKEEGFAQIEGQIHEVKLDPGAYEHVSLNGITFDVLCLNHMRDGDPEKEQMGNMAFFVELGGVRFLHLGDSFIDQSEAHLNNYPFERSPVDILFLNQYDRSEMTPKFIAEKIKPSQIVAMHIPPAELEEESKNIRAAYPHAIVFKQSMERRSVPIEVDFHNLSGAWRDEYSAERVAEFRRLAAGSKLEIREVDGDHMGCLRPALAQFLEIVKSDAAETPTAPASQTATDIDGNVYKTVTIGNQVWMAEDLRTTRYRNGDSIGTTTPARLDIGGESAPKYQWAYAGDEGNVATYGRLYTWHVVTDPRGLAPSGWHVPTDAEWRALCDYLGGPDAVGGKLKAAGAAVWRSPNADATNATGFTALPSGARWANGTFSQLGECVHYWTSTPAAEDPHSAWRWLVQPGRVRGVNAPTLQQGYAPKAIGFPVRCVRDASTLPTASLAEQENTGTVSPGAPQRPPLDVTYIGNEGFMIQAAGKKVLVDALFDNEFFLAPSQELLAQMTGGSGPFADVDLLLVTHPHADHFNPKLVVDFLRNHARCQLVAHTQTVDELRKEDGYAQIENQIHEVRLEPGLRESITINGIALDVLSLDHSPYYQNGRWIPEHLPGRMDVKMKDLAFIANLGGTRFLHMGDASVENSLEHLNAYPFDETPVDLLFLECFDRSQATQQFIARKIKPSRIVAMHIPPAELEDESKSIRAAYPHAVIFKQSMERHSLPIEVDFHNLTGEYFGQAPPGATPQVFARGIVSTEYQDHGPPSFSHDGNEVFWREARRPGLDNKEWEGFNMTMRRENGRWSSPYVDARYDGHFVLPVFSADGRRAYFSSARPRSGEAQVSQPDFDIWFVERHADDWGEPKCLNLVARYPELRWAGFPSMLSITGNGTLYFMGYTPGPLNDYGIYRSELVNGEYAKPELLPRSINLPPFLNWEPFIAPDESYLLFSSNRRDPDHDAGDLYISRRQSDGRWTDPVSLGGPINSPSQERLPGVSRDGKYLFFTRWTPDHDEDVYWVDAASIPALRSTAAPSQEIK